MEDTRSFKDQGATYQEKVVQALFEDSSYADMMVEILAPEYFTYSYLRELVAKFFDYRRSYKEFPSWDMTAMLVERDPSCDDDLALLTLVRTYVARAKAEPLNGDGAWIKEDSLDFCRRGCLVNALGKILDQVEGKKYDSIAGTLREALNKGTPKDAGHEYNEDLDIRTAASIRKPMQTPWPVLDRYLNGGWERKTLTTFIAPTGAGKSMFLVNCACAAVEAGLSVLYVTLEMADFKIGLRADSWYSGISINEVANNKPAVRKAIDERARGRLLIKEWPTKRASVETIRAHVERLKQTKDFVPDTIIVDYADLLRPSRSYGEKRHELEGIYEELRGLGQELNCNIITADQTNRGGLDLELVTLSAIAESYAKATVCDLILTISRTPEDRASGTGRLFIAKSRLGEDGKVLPFLLNLSSSVRVELLDQNDDPFVAQLQRGGEGASVALLRKRATEISSKKRVAEDDGK